MLDLVMEHHIKMDYVKNFRKNPEKPNLGSQNVLHDNLCLFLRNSRVLKFAIFG